MKRISSQRPSWLWDYDIDDESFGEILAGRQAIGRLDRDWAAIRLLEYAPYRDIVRLLGFREIIAGWSRWRTHIRSRSRQRGFDFLVEWLPKHYPEWIYGCHSERVKHATLMKK